MLLLGGPEWGGVAADCGIRRSRETIFGVRITTGLPTTQKYLLALPDVTVKIN
jgi:hypothetical protein